MSNKARIRQYVKQRKEVVYLLEDLNPVWRSVLPDHLLALITITRVPRTRNCKN